MFVFKSWNSACSGFSSGGEPIGEGRSTLSALLPAILHQALGFQLERMLGMDAETLARAGEGNRDTLAEITDILVEGAKRRSDDQRPSMAQDIAKGRRTETDFINGYVAARGTEIGVPAPLHARVNELVRRVERREITAGPHLIEGI